MLNLNRMQAELLSQQSNTFEALGYYFNAPVDIRDRRFARTELVVTVSRRFFDVFGTAPTAGRMFSSDDFVAGSAPTVILAYSAWKQSFGLKSTAIGQTINLNGSLHTVIGVMPEGFQFPSSETQMWVPYIEPLGQTEADRFGDKYVVALLRRDVTISQAQASMNLIAETLKQRQMLGRPEFSLSLAVRSLRDQVIGPMKRVLALLLSVVGIVQLIACANIAMLMLSRNSVRRREIVIKLALGASYHRIVRQLILESMLLSLLGGCFGFVLAMMGAAVEGHTLLVFLVPNGSFAFDYKILLFSVTVAEISGLLFGFIGSLEGVGPDLIKHLNEYSSTLGGVGSVLGERIQEAIVTCEVVLTTVLLIVFGILLRSLLNTISVDIGFHSEHVIALQLSSARVDASRRDIVQQQVISELRHLPGVVDVALGTMRPFAGGTIETSFTAENTQSGWVASPDVEMQSVSADYFRTLGIPILQGRPLTDRDTHNAPCAIVVSAGLRDLLWPDRNALGQKIDLNGGLGTTPYLCWVVGVAGNVRDVELHEPPRPEIYFSCLQRNAGTNSLVIKTRGNEIGLVRAIADRMSSVDKSQEVLSIEGIEETMSRSMAGPELRTTIFGLFAALALGSSMIGLYAVTSYSVVRRTKEFAIRLAFGAGPSEIGRIVILQALSTSVRGLVLGELAAMWVCKVLSTTLPDAKGVDPVVQIIVAVGTLVVVLCASIIPVRRALRVHPAVVLRYE